MADSDEEGARRDRFAAAARAERPDLGLLCLLVAAEADPGSAGAAEDDVERELDRLAGEIAGLAAGGDGSPESWAAALRAVLGARHGFQGRAADYGLLSSSLLPAVLHRRRGLPILLSVVWMEAGRRAGAPVYGVARPGHFVVGVGDPAGRHVLADPFHGGRPLPPDDPAAPPDPAAEPLDVVARVLGNIRVWATGRPERSAVRLWAVELSLLLPRHPARLRLERARLLVERGDFLRGAAELEAYAEVVDILDPDAAATIRRQARAARALLN